jgi:hypothetical protein
MGLQFVHLEGGGTSGRTSQLAGSVPGSSSGSRRGSSADLTRMPSSEQPLSAALASQPSLRGRAPAGRAVQMLSASLDLSVAYKMEASPVCPAHSLSSQRPGIRLELALKPTSRSLQTGCPFLAGLAYLLPRC